MSTRKRIHLEDAEGIEGARRRTALELHKRQTLRALVEGDAVVESPRCAFCGALLALVLLIPADLRCVECGAWSRFGKAAS